MWVVAICIVHVMPQIQLRSNEREVWAYKRDLFTLRYQSASTLWYLNLLLVLSKFTNRDTDGKTDPYVAAWNRRQKLQNGLHFFCWCLQGNLARCPPPILMKLKYVKKDLKKWDRCFVYRPKNGLRGWKLPPKFALKNRFFSISRKIIIFF